MAGHPGVAYPQASCKKLMACDHRVIECYGFSGQKEIPG